MEDQKKPTDIIAWFKENLERLKQKSPKFFRVWNTINSVILFVAGLPVLLTQFGFTDLNLLPAYVLKIIAFASAWGLFMNRLTIKSQSEIIITESGLVIQKPKDSLPFSEKKEDIKVVGDVEKLLLK